MLLQMTLFHFFMANSPLYKMNIPHLLYPFICWWIFRWLPCLEVAQSCPTLCDPMDCSPPSSSVHGILQARVLEWIAISCSNSLVNQRLLQHGSEVCGVWSQVARVQIPVLLLIRCETMSKLPDLSNPHFPHL